MKTPILALFVLLLATGVAPALVTASTDSASQFSVTILKYEPVPAKPGDVIDAWLQISNTGDNVADTVQLMVDESYPFMPASAQDKLISIGTLSAQSDYVTRVRIAVNKDSPEGTFLLHTSVTSGGAVSTSFELPIQVQSGRTSLAVTTVKTTPAELIPGSKASITLQLENQEESVLRDVTVSLGLASTVFSPLDGTTQQKLARFGGKEKMTFVFSIIPDPTAASSVYRLPVTITYTTNDGITTTQQETIGVIVRAQPEITVIVDQTKLYSKGIEGTVLLRVVNKGLSQIKFTEATILLGQGYELAGNSPTVYVGNIDSDDFDTSEFTIKPTADSLNLKLHLSYKDSLNNAYTKDVELPIVLQPQNGTSSNTWVYIVVAIALIAGVIVWRSTRKGKH